MTGRKAVEGKSGLSKYFTFVCAICVVSFTQKQIIAASSNLIFGLGAIIRLDNQIL